MRPALSVVMVVVFVLSACGGGESEDTVSPEEQVSFSTVDTDPDWSPDGGLIAFASSREGGGLYVIRPDGTGMRRLYRGAASNVDWSPDGRRIAFEGAHGIYLIARAGGPPTQILRDQFSRPAWAPDGRKLAVVRWQPDVTTVIDIVGADGSGLRRLLRDHRPRGPRRGALAASEADPTWSPEGREIAFSAGAEAVVVAEVAGGRRRVIAARGFDPAWSPDGRLIALDSDTGGLWVVKADGSGDMRLLAHNGGDASWSPDSRSLVYEVRHWYGRFHRRPQSLSVVDAAGGAPRKLTFGGAAWDDPAWRGDPATP